MLNSMVGPKLSDSLLHLAHVPEALVNETIERYRRHYRETGIGQSKPYPGIYELLQYFAASGRAVAVATQKPQSIARLVLEHHHIADFFVSIRGAADNESLEANTASGKIEIVGAALSDLNSQPAVMVGDRHQDVAGAMANGLDCIGVSWGFAPDGELEEAGAVAVVHTAVELRTKIEELDAVRATALSEVQNDGSL